MRKRRGISQIAVTTVLIVLGISASLLIFGPLRGYIISAFKRTTTVGGGTQLEIIAVEHSSGIIQDVVVKNIGPNNLQSGSWQVIIDDNMVGSQNAGLSVDSTLTIDVSAAGISDTTAHSIVVYGPQGTVAQTTYTP